MRRGRARNRRRKSRSSASCAPSTRRTSRSSESILDDSGIEYYIQGEETIHIRPLVDPANVLVVKERAEDAMALLKDLDLSFYLFKPDDSEKSEPDDESSK